MSRLRRLDPAATLTHKKSQLLGENFSTAAHKLRKMVLFALLQRHDENVCSRCGEIIATVGELSLEHVKPWQAADDPRVSFFELSNIAFSHLRCNVGARRSPENGHVKNRKVGVDGTEWCGTCRKFLPTAAFTANSSRWNGVQDQCRDCRAATR